VDDGKKLRFIPLKTAILANEIFKHAKTVVIMSATIIDPKNFCKNLGIKDYEYIETGSVFDSEKSPIYIMTKQKINFSNLKTMLPILAKQVSDLLEAHPHEKGIIHTHTQYIADYIRENVRSIRLLCRETGIKNEDILKAHEESSDPTVLVSPSMSYGVDLKGDLAKFQIIMKAPWLPTKEVRINKMMNVDKQWYANKMLCTLVQSCGRGVRSNDDECVTYILDGGTYDCIVNNKSRLPKFFLDRLQ
jgi:Rad3-related DNA helicase